MCLDTPWGQLMIFDLKPYPSIKGSGVEWLGRVPEHWDLVPNRALMSLRKEVVGDRADDYILLSLTKQGIIARDMENPEGKFPASFDTYQVVEPGDLIFCLFDIDETPRAVGLSGLSGMITGAYTRFVCSDLNARRFIYLLYLSLDSGKLLKPLYSGLRKTIQKGVFLSAKVALPPLSEQTAIVRFLDYADRRISKYIRTKQKLVGLLEEQKQAIIHRAVTLGLDPYAPLKDSGVEWLGDVPEHWEVARVKKATEILRGKFTHRPRNDPSFYDGPYPFIQTGEVARAKKTIVAYRQTLNDKGLSVSKMFPAGTLVMTIAANIGDVAVLDFEACFPDSIVGFVTKKGILRDYLYYLFTAMKPELLREAPVNTQGNLNIDRIGSRRIPIPSIEEQMRIVQSIEKKNDDSDIVIERANSEVKLLQEYRTRLIADVVTGKLDVREAAANLPDQLEETAAPDETGVQDDYEEELEMGEALKNNHANTR